MKVHADDALRYHSRPPAGKLSVTPTKPCRTQRDLSLAYTPGVAVPCLEIAADPSLAYKYTGKGNLVAVVTNGTAVLGLGNIGAAGRQAGHGRQRRSCSSASPTSTSSTSNWTPRTPRKIIRACQLLEPTFGGINLEDIKAPECFIIEEELQQTMNIPVFHDDQHGTAIISGAALLNAAGTDGQEDRGRQGGLQRRRRQRRSPAPSFYVRLGVTARKHHHVRHQGRDLQRAAPRG